MRSGYSNCMAILAMIVATIVLNATPGLPQDSGVTLIDTSTETPGGNSSVATGSGNGEFHFSGRNTRDFYLFLQSKKDASGWVVTAQVKHLPLAFAGIPAASQVMFTLRSGQKSQDQAGVRKDDQRTAVVYFLSEGPVYGTVNEELWETSFNVGQTLDPKATVHAKVTFPKDKGITIPILNWTIGGGKTPDPIDLEETVASSKHQDPPPPPPPAPSVPDGWVTLPGGLSMGINVLNGNDWDYDFEMVLKGTAAALAGKSMVINTGNGSCTIQGVQPGTILTAHYNIGDLTDLSVPAAAFSVNKIQDSTLVVWLRSGSNDPHPEKVEFKLDVNKKVTATHASP
jgi:hypothetical protein